MYFVDQVHQTLFIFHKVIGHVLCRLGSLDNIYFSLIYNTSQQTTWNVRIGNCPKYRGISNTLQLIVIVNYQYGTNTNVFNIDRSLNQNVLINNCFHLRRFPLYQQQFSALNCTVQLLCYQTLCLCRLLKLQLSCFKVKRAKK